jgi:hypothetical protein
MYLLKLIHPGMESDAVEFGRMRGRMRSDLAGCAECARMHPDASGCIRECLIFTDSKP